jgi:hypothetical protein
MERDEDKRRERREEHRDISVERREEGKHARTTLLLVDSFPGHTTLFRDGSPCAIFDSKGQR